MCMKNFDQDLYLPHLYTVQLLQIKTRLYPAGDAFYTDFIVGAPIYKFPSSNPVYLEDYKLDFWIPNGTVDNNQTAFQCGIYLVDSNTNDVRYSPLIGVTIPGETVPVNYAEIRVNHRNNYAKIDLECSGVRFDNLGYTLKTLPGFGFDDSVLAVHTLRYRILK